MNSKTGKGAYTPGRPVYIVGYGSAAGEKESKGPFGAFFDYCAKDDRMNMKSFELAETRFTEKAVAAALKRSGRSFDSIDALLGGDLMNQCTATSYFARSVGRPFIGLFNACATMAEAMALSALLVGGGGFENVLAAASSHFCTAERQFRFPLEYGGQRSPAAQWTVTASGAAVISSEPSESAAEIAGVYFGKVRDLGIKDASNMGAAMAPAFCDTLEGYFEDTKTVPSDYDLIVSGDLGAVGAGIVKEIFDKKGVPLGDVYNDCGLLVFDREKDDVHSGGSGCGCSAAVLCAKILPDMLSGSIKRALFIGTGALMSPMLVMQKESIPGIAHLIELRQARL